MPRAVPAHNSEICLRDNEGELWRAMTYLESEPTPDSEPDAETLTMFGTLLAELHRSLATLDFTPEYTIPNFHNTAFYAGRLEELCSRLMDTRARVLADEALRAYASLQQLPQTTEQLIHGDPRTANMLFRKGKPFTYIDFDTVMRGTMWLDLGDLLRSLVEDTIQDGSDPAALRLDLVIDGYQRTAQIEVADKVFTDWSLTAARRITLELTMRFLLDMVDDSYFSWDVDKYSSRSEHNFARANLQWHIVNSLVERSREGKSRA